MAGPLIGWPPAATQMIARVSPATQPKVFLHQMPSLFPGFGTSLEYAGLHTLRLGSDMLNICKREAE